MTGFTDLTSHLSIFSGSINVGVIHDGGDALLIDCDDAHSIEAVSEHGLTPTRALFTHYHRDSAAGAYRLIADDVPITVPDGAQDYFSNAAAIWRDPEFYWHWYMFRPHPLLLTRSVPVDETIGPGDTIEWGPATITAIPTRGHTEHSLSYRITVDGECYTFCGDTLCADGRLVDIYSLQRGHGAHRDYHVFLGDRQRYVDGLQRLSGTGPIIPARGDLIGDARDMINRIERDLERLYRNYASTSAFRHYNPDHFDDLGAVDWVPFGEFLPVPRRTRHVGTSWLLESDTGNVLVMDCGSTFELETFADWGLTPESVSGCWISHYHDDHTEELPALRDRYGCPLMAGDNVADVVERPGTYRLPGLAPIDVSIDRRLADGEQWDWHEWTLTNYWFPGQTFYHCALLAEGHGHRLLFAGDAFTPTGIDDYCTRNRNLLGPDRGYRRCLDIVADLEPTHVFNSHLSAPFSVGNEAVPAIDRMLDNRATLLDRLVIGHFNSGIDPHWVRCRPYRQLREPGDLTTIQVETTNYTNRSRPVAIRPRPGPLAPPEDPTPDWLTTSIPPGETTSIPVRIQVPSDPDRDRYVMTVDIRWRGRDRLRYREAVLTVAE